MLNLKLFQTSEAGHPFPFLSIKPFQIQGGRTLDNSADESKLMQFSLPASTAQSEVARILQKPRGSFTNESTKVISWKLGGICGADTDRQLFRSVDFSRT